MSEKKAIKLVKKAWKLKGRQKLQEALIVIDDALKIYPDVDQGLFIKGQILDNLGRREEAHQIYLKVNLMRIKQKVPLPADINSKEGWLEEGIKLLENANYELAMDFFLQASYLCPIENENGFFHNNAKIWYYYGIAKFKEMENIDVAVAMLNKAFNLDSNFKAPDDIKAIYNKYKANRNGEGVYMMVDINTTGLKELIPPRDMILVSTIVQASYSQAYGNKSKLYYWDTPLLISDNGLVYRGSNMSREKAYYVPLEDVVISGHGKVRDLAVLMDGKPLNLRLKRDKRFPSIEEQFKYIDYFRPIIGEKQQNRRNMIKFNIESLEDLPSYEDYIKQFGYTHKPLFKQILKEIKKEKKLKN